VSTQAAETRTAAEVARSYFEAIAAHDIDAMMEHWEPGGIGYLHGVRNLRAPEDYREWFGNLFRALPDYRFEILDLVAEGGKAAVRWRAEGTFDGSAKLEGFAPTGGRITMEGCDLLTIRDGLIRENRAYTNSMDAARQIGALPPQGSRAEKAMAAAFNARTAAARRLRGLRRRP
jgi:predicted ester cyclase